MLVRPISGANVLGQSTSQYARGYQQEALNAQRGQQNALTLARAAKLSDLQKRASQGMTPEIEKELAIYDPQGQQQRLATEKQRLSTDLATGGSLALSVLNAPKEQRADVFRSALENASRLGMNIDGLPQEYTPETESYLTNMKNMAGLKTSQESMDLKQAEAGIELYKEQQKSQMKYTSDVNLENLKSRNEIEKTKLQNRGKIEAARQKALGDSSGNGMPGLTSTPINNGAMLQIDSGLASEFGVPSTAPNPYMNIKSSKQRDKMVSKVRMQAEKKLEKGQAGVDAAGVILQSMNRALELLDAGVGTGAEYSIPFSETAASAVSSNIAEFSSITSKMTPLMRQGMPGAASDRDVAMFKNATIGLKKPEQANRNIAMALKSAAQNKIDQSFFMDNYLSAHGHLRGAERAWKGYLGDNPIFAKDSGKDYKLNPSRLSAQEYFAKQNSASSGGAMVPDAQQGQPQVGVVDYAEYFK